MTAPAPDQVLPPLRIFWGRRFDERTMSWHLDLFPSREMTPAEREGFRRLAAIVAGMVDGSVQ